jgi:hypothetical protein
LIVRELQMQYNRIMFNMQELFLFIQHFLKII